MSNSTILVTGGAGFIGAHFVEHIFRQTNWDILVLDRLNYAGDLNRLSQFAGSNRVSYIYHDFRAAFPASLLGRFNQSKVKCLAHFGAETHVDRSLSDPLPFVESNVLGTANVLQAARAISSLEKMIMVSTDEVFGPAGPGQSHREGDTHRPSNPYAASKSGAEQLCQAWAHSFNLPVIITRTMNNFGERQHPEKFVPMVLKRLLANKEVTIHAGIDGTIGSRKWLHARNHADAILFLLNHPTFIPGEAFHIAGEERNNLEIARLISEFADKPLTHSLVDFHSSRPGHDLRYSLDDSKIRALGWAPPVEFVDGLRRMVEWTLQNREWLNG